MIGFIVGILVGGVLGFMTAVIVDPDMDDENMFDDEEI